MARNELDKAVERLERVANNAVDEQLRPIARLRLARVQAAQGKHDVALATLGTADMGEHQAAYARDAWRHPAIQGRSVPARSVNTRLH